jgi:hypothetical protein
MPLLFILAYGVFFAVQVGGLDVPALVDAARAAIADLMARFAR